MKELIGLVGQAKARMDEGFSRVGRVLDPADPGQRALMLLASRCAAVGNAVMVLAQHQHGNEALPLVRSLFELSLRMRHIAQAESRARAEELFAELSRCDWTGFWNTERLRRWMDDFEVPETAGELLGRLCADHAQANALGLPWGHVFAQNQAGGLSSEDVLKLAAIALGQALKALEIRWPGSFGGAEQIWEKATLTR